MRLTGLFAQNPLTIMQKKIQRGTKFLGI